MNVWDPNIGGRPAPSWGRGPRRRNPDGDAERFVFTHHYDSARKSPHVVSIPMISAGVGKALWTKLHYSGGMIEALDKKTGRRAVFRQTMFAITDSDVKRALGLFPPKKSAEGRVDDYRRGINPQDEEIRRLERLAAQGDLAARERLRQLRSLGGRDPRRPRWAARLPEVRRAHGLVRKCPTCGRKAGEPVTVHLEQMNDATTEDGRHVPYGTPGSEGQVLVTACSRCLDFRTGHLVPGPGGYTTGDSSISGSSWEDMDGLAARGTYRRDGFYTILNGEIDAVAKEVQSEGYRVLYSNPRRYGNPPRARRNPLHVLPFLGIGAVEALGGEAARHGVRRLRQRRNPLGTGLVEGLASGIGLGVAWPIVTRFMGTKHLTARKQNGRRQNPLAPFITMVGNPRNDHGSANATRGPHEGAMTIKLPSHLVRGTISIQEALRRNIPGIREAIRGFVKFHGGIRPTDEVVIVNDGRSDSDSGYMVGETPEVTYHRVPQGSNKEGSPWGHHTSKSKPTYLVHSPRTGMFHLIGSMYATDWLRG